jgi:ribosome-associated heat shock protein Hsp15
LKQRIDKWLWHARVVRTRSSAAALVDDGLVRLNGERVSANSQPVKTSDVLTIALDRHIRIMKVMGFAERRGDATDAAKLFEDLTPKPEPGAPVAAASGARDPGAGRPTKQERRAIDRLQEGADPKSR